MDEIEDITGTSLRDWQVERVLEPKDALIPKGMKTIAKTLRHAGQLLAVATAPNPMTPRLPVMPLSPSLARTALKLRRSSAS